MGVIVHTAPSNYTAQGPCRTPTSSNFTRAVSQFKDRPAGPAAPVPGARRFLSLRVSVELLVNIAPRETRIAVVENGMLQEVFVERANRRGLVGNIYKGRVCRVLPGMQAAFVDVGLDRAAFLHASDVWVPNGAGAAAPPPAPGAAGNGAAEHSREAPRTRPPHPDITELLHQDQEIMVQILKAPIGGKGARLTTQIAIPSRYLVYVPGGGGVGVSQRIESPEERERLRLAVQGLMSRDGGPAAGDPSRPNHPIPGNGYIVRTAGESVAESTLRADMDFLHRLWDSVKRRAQHAPPATLVHEDLPLVIRTLRELSGTEVERARVDCEEALRDILEFTQRFIPELAGRIERYTGERPIFDLYGVEDEIQKALGRRVALKSGGHLVIDQTEAMTTIDVNTGGYVGHRNLEETIFKTNLEATQAIARQLRLRNLGGIIIIDFIDMEDPAHRRQVLRSLEKMLGRDHTRTAISEVSPLGLVQMTRKRTRESLEHQLCDPCPTCGGRGSIKNPDTVCYEIFRDIMREARQYDTTRMLVIASSEVIDTLMDEESATFAEIEAFIGRPITLQVEAQYTREQFDVVLM